MDPAGDLAVGVAAGAAFVDLAAGGALRAADGEPRDAAARLCDLAAESGGGVRVDSTVRDACRKTHDLAGGTMEAAFGGYRVEGGSDAGLSDGHSDGRESEEENAVARAPASVPLVRGRERFGTRRETVRRETVRGETVREVVGCRRTARAETVREVVGCRRTARALGGAAKEALETFRRTTPRVRKAPGARAP